MIGIAGALALMTAASPAAAEPAAATEPAEPLTSPETVTHEESHAKMGLVIGGVATFGVSWMLAALMVMTRPAQNPAPLGMPTSYGGPKDSLIIPFAGPFLQMSSTGVSGIGNVIYAADGVAQIAGAAMTVVGLAWRTKVIVPDSAAQIRVAPMKLGQAGTGVGISGTF